MAGGARCRSRCRFARRPEPGGRRDLSCRWGGEFEHRMGGRLRRRSRRLERSGRPESRVGWPRRRARIAEGPVRLPGLTPHGSRSPPSSRDGSTQCIPRRVRCGPTTPARRERPATAAVVVDDDHGILACSACLSALGGQQIGMWDQTGTDQHTHDKVLQAPSAARTVAAARLERRSVSVHLMTSTAIRAARWATARPATLGVWLPQMHSLRSPPTVRPPTKAARRARPTAAAPLR
jgi:hypothetical protein